MLRDRAGVDDRLAFAHGELRVLPVLRHLDAIEAGPRKGDLAVRRVDARRFARLQHAYAKDHLALRDIQREIGVVQPRKVQAGVGREAELADAEVDFGAAVIAHPEIVAARDRIVDADGDPLLGCVLRRQEQFAADVGDTADAWAQVIIRARRRRQQAGKREKHEQSGDNTARNLAVQHMRCDRCVGMRGGMIARTCGR